MAHWVKVLGTKLDDNLSSIPKDPHSRREQFPRLSSDLHTHPVACGLQRLKQDYSNSKTNLSYIVRL